MLVSVANFNGSSVGPHQSNSWKNGYPDQISISQEKSPSIKELAMLSDVHILGNSTGNVQGHLSWICKVWSNRPSFPSNENCSRALWAGTNGMWSKCALRQPRILCLLAAIWLTFGGVLLGFPQCNRKRLGSSQRLSLLAATGQLTVILSAPSCHSRRTFAIWVLSVAGLIVFI